MVHVQVRRQTSRRLLAALKGLGALAMVLIIPFGAARAQDGRISGPADPQKRCGGTPVPPDLCKALQTKARDRGCVTVGEYDALVRYGSFATCDYDYTPPLFEGWCACGCFDESVRIMASSGTEAMAWQPAGDIANHFHQYQLAALTPTATLGAPEFAKAAIRIATKGPEKKPMFVIGTRYGKGLKLTSEHAVLLAEGKMVLAKSLVVGQELAGVYGEPIRIESIEQVQATSDVVNFATEEQSQLSHILAAEGVLVGDLLWQSSYADALNAVIIRQ